MTKTLQMTIFVMIVILILGSIHYYLWIRLIKSTGLVGPFKQVATGVLMLLAISVPVCLYFARGVSFQASRFISIVPHVWLGIMMLFFFFFLTIDIFKVLGFTGRKLAVGGHWLPDITHRVIIGKVVAIAALVVVGAVTVFSIGNVYRSPIIKTTQINLKKLPQAMSGFKIVQLSDLHLGVTFGRAWMAQVVKMTNALQPDIVVITGDLVDAFPHKVRQEIAPLANLKTNHGVFFVTGNHEYYFGVNGWLKELEKLGVQVLRNQRVEIVDNGHSFYLAGVDDYNSKSLAKGHNGPDISGALVGRDPSKPVVLLAHQPRTVHEADALDVDLVLSGHTHGGQIWPFTYFVGLQQPYNRGLYRHSETTWIYVNQGTGHWGPPMRLGTKNEISQLILQKE